MSTLCCVLEAIYTRKGQASCLWQFIAESGVLHMSHREQSRLEVMHLYINGQVKQKEAARRVLLWKAGSGFHNLILALVGALFFSFLFFLAPRGEWLIVAIISYINHFAIKV